MQGMLDTNFSFVKIHPDAVGKKLDCMCVYEDDDCEDLTFNELKRLATLSPHKYVGTIKVTRNIGISGEGCGKCLKVEIFFNLAERNGELSNAAFVIDIVYDSGANWLEANLKSVCVTSLLSYTLSHAVVYCQCNTSQSIWKMCSRLDYSYRQAVSQRIK